MTEKTRKMPPLTLPSFAPVAAYLANRTTQPRFGKPLPEPQLGESVEALPVLDMGRKSVADTLKKKPAESVAALPEICKPLPVAVTATGNGNTETEQQSNVIPGFKNKRDKQKALAKAREAIKTKTLKPAVRPIAEYCNVGTRGAQWIQTELVNDGTLERTETGATRLPKEKADPVTKELVDALTDKKFGWSKSDAVKMANRAKGETLDKRITHALKLVNEMRS